MFTRFITKQFWQVAYNEYCINKTVKICKPFNWAINEIWHSSHANLSSPPRSKVPFLSNDDTLSSEAELASCCCCVNLLCIVGLGCATSCKDGGVVSDELLDALMVWRSDSSAPYTAAAQIVNNIVLNIHCSPVGVLHRNTSIIHTYTYIHTWNCSPKLNSLNEQMHVLDLSQASVCVNIITTSLS